VQNLTLIFISIYLIISIIENVWSITKDNFLQEKKDVEKR